MKQDGSAPPLAPRPVWLEAGELPWRLLERFLDKLERNQRLSLRITAKSAPPLYNFQGEDVDYLWELLRSLDRDFHVFSIELARVRPHQPVYENALLRFDPAREALVRHWLARPALDPYALLWQQALEKLRGSFEDEGRALENRIIRVPGQSPERILRAFASLGPALAQASSLRSLSARCFWGDSKFLERSEDLLRALFPTASRQLAARPILMNVHLPPVLAQVLFVENQDRFLALRPLVERQVALVYAAGFRSSATRIRVPGNAVFSYLHSEGQEAARRGFEAWWFGGTSESGDLPCWFWGDLDYSGMGILRALRTVFPGMSAWRPGYEALLALLEQGGGHGPLASGKELQQDPLSSGCAYADQVLLPALRSSGRSVDQEAIDLNDCDGFSRD